MNKSFMRHYFYVSDELTNSIKAMKKGDWSWQSSDQKLYQNNNNLSVCWRYYWPYYTPHELLRSRWCSKACYFLLQEKYADTNTQSYLLQLSPWLVLACFLPINLDRRISLNSAKVTDESFLFKKCLCCISMLFLFYCVTVCSSKLQGLTIVPYLWCSLNFYLLRDNIYQGLMKVTCKFLSY